jgi:hypothetical protein
MPLPANSERWSRRLKTGRSLFDRSGGDNRFKQRFFFEYAELERRTGHKKEAKELS